MEVLLYIFKINFVISLIFLNIRSNIEICICFFNLKIKYRKKIILFYIYEDKNKIIQYLILIFFFCLICKNYKNIESLKL